MCRLYVVAVVFLQNLWLKTMHESILLPKCNKVDKIVNKLNLVNNYYQQNSAFLFYFLFLYFKIFVLPFHLDLFFFFTYKSQNSILMQTFLTKLDTVHVNIPLPNVISWIKLNKLNLVIHCTYGWIIITNKIDIFFIFLFVLQNVRFVFPFGSFFFVPRNHKILF